MFPSVGGRKRELSISNPQIRNILKRPVGKLMAPSANWLGRQPFKLEMYCSIQTGAASLRKNH